MGRTLPWRRNEEAAATNKTSGSVTSTSRLGTPSGSTARAKGPSLASSSRAGARSVPTKLDRVNDSSDQKHDHDQAPSTPRQPEPVPETFMVPGLQNDDKWRMVEDEFVAVAHKFTAHLHAAEYQRLKERAKARNSEAIRSISRPVAGPMTDNVRRRQAALSLQKSQSKGIKRALSRTNDADEDDVDELPWAGTNLQDLMNSPRKKPVPLTTMVSTVSGTRAAALSRQDRVSKSQASFPKRTTGRPGNSSLQAGSPSIRRATPVGIQDEDDSGGGDLERYSASRRPARKGSSTSGPAVKAPNPRSTALGPASASATATPAPVTVAPRKPVSIPSATNDGDDSDSPVETFFERRMRERRAQRKVLGRNKSSTPDTAKEESEPSQKSQKSQVPSALSIPSL